METPHRIAEDNVDEIPPAFDYATLENYPH